MTNSRFSQDFTGLTSLTVDHNLGQWPVVQVIDTVTGLVLVPVSIQQVTANQCLVTMGLAGNYRVVCVI